MAIRKGGPSLVMNGEAALVNHDRVVVVGSVFLSDCKAKGRRARSKN